MTQLINQMALYISEFTKNLVKKFHKNFDKKSIVINNSVPLKIFNPKVKFKKRIEVKR